MHYPIRISDNAAKHISDANEWWDANRLSAIGAVKEELEILFSKLANNHHIGNLCDHPDNQMLRRLYIKRLRYHLYYDVNDAEQTIDVVALWHSSRENLPPLD